MSLPYQMVFDLLVFEMVVFGILVMPLPTSFRKAMISWVSKSPLVNRFAFIMNILFIFVFVLFLDSINRVWRIEEEVRAEKSHHHHSGKADAILHSKLFYSQRNMYLTGFTLFLSVILNRFYVLLKDLIKLEERAAVVTKQSDNNNKTIRDKLTQLEKAESKIKELEAKLNETGSQQKDLETMKSQANNNNKQYMELADRYNELEKKYDLLRIKMKESDVDTSNSGNRRVSKKDE